MHTRSFAIILAAVLISTGNAWASPVTSKMSYFKMDRHDSNRYSYERHDDDRRSENRHDEMRDDFDYDEIIMPPDDQGDSKIVFEKVELFKKKSWFTESFYIDTAGTYLTTLTDFEFPNPLKYSGLNITTAKDSLGKLLGPGSFTFDAEPGKYYVSFFARASYKPLWSIDMDMEDYGWGYDHYGNKLGQYGIEISMLPSAVPVPAAAWLFGSGLVGMLGVAKRKKAA